MLIYWQGNYGEGFGEKRLVFDDAEREPHFFEVTKRTVAEAEDQVKQAASEGMKALKTEMASPEQVEKALAVVKGNVEKTDTSLSLLEFPAGAFDRLPVVKDGDFGTDANLDKVVAVVEGILDDKKVEQIVKNLPNIVVGLLPEGAAKDKGFVANVLAVGVLEKANRAFEASEHRFYKEGDFDKFDASALTYQLSVEKGEVKLNLKEESNFPEDAYTKHFAEKSGVELSPEEKAQAIIDERIEGMKNHPILGMLGDFPGSEKIYKGLAESNDMFLGFLMGMLGVGGFREFYDKGKKMIAKFTPDLGKKLDHYQKEVQRVATEMVAEFGGKEKPIAKADFVDTFDKSVPVAVAEGGLKLSDDLEFGSEYESVIVRLRDGQELELGDKLKDGVEKKNGSWDGEKTLKGPGDYVISSRLPKGTVLPEGAMLALNKKVEENAVAEAGDAGVEAATDTDAQEGETELEVGDSGSAKEG